MVFRDTVNLYGSKTTTYNQTPSPDSDDKHVVKGTIEETAGLTRQGYYDQLAGDAHLYLPGSITLSLEGMFAEYGDNMYRITAVSKGKAALTSNRMKLIECNLESVDKAAL